MRSTSRNVAETRAHYGKWSSPATQTTLEPSVLRTQQLGGDDYTPMENAP